MQRTWLWIVTFLYITGGVGCGYHFSPGGEHIDSAVKTVYVAAFVNQTDEANLGNYMRSAFINQFRKGSRFTLASHMQKADALLTGTVRRSSVSHVAYTATDVAKENKAYLTIDITFKKTADNEIIWSNRNFSGNEAYTVETDPNATETNRKNALRKLADDMAARAYRNIMSGF